MKVRTSINEGRPVIVIEPWNALERSTLEALGPDHGRPRVLIAECDGEKMTIREAEATSLSSGETFNHLKIVP